MRIILLSSILLCANLLGYGQSELMNIVKKKTKNRIHQNTGKGVEKGLDKAEEGAIGVFKNSKKDKDDQQTQPSGTDENVKESVSDREEDIKVAPELKWSKYDFVPGDKIIFEDILNDEENGEFPSRWDLKNGVVEVAELGGEAVIMFRGGSPSIIPYLENSDKDYLPEIFTIEFDMHLGGSGGWVDMYFYDGKNQREPSGNQYRLQIMQNKMSIFGSESYYPNKTIERNRWIHVSVAYTRGKLKAYMDDTRLINIPRLDIDPQGVTLHSYHASDDNPIYFKNIRIAEGGVRYYDRVLQDGKIVSNGIRFDVGKATIKPESMGVINTIYELMKEHTNLNFSVEGHTDSDGGTETNQQLSKKRAEAVMNRLILMGISKDRLTSKGFGEIIPVAPNTTSEGKASNRRVEFVKT